MIEVDGVACYSLPYFYNFHRQRRKLAIEYDYVLSS
jgi:hypothetical protein